MINAFSIRKIPKVKDSDNGVELVQILVYDKQKSDQASSVFWKIHSFLNRPVGSNKSISALTITIEDESIKTDDDWQLKTIIISNIRACGCLNKQDSI